jgi:hypothetical protein
VCVEPNDAIECVVPPGNYENPESIRAKFSTLTAERDALKAEVARLRAAYDIEAALATGRIAALTNDNARLRGALTQLRRSHYECRDDFFSCPVVEWEKATPEQRVLFWTPDGMRPSCDCGADLSNAIVDAALCGPK